MNTLKKLAVLAIVLLLSACASTTTGEQNLLSANQYLQLAEGSAGELHVHYQLLAAKRLLADRKIKQAEPILTRYQKVSLSPKLTVERDLLTARYLLDTNRPKQALAALNQLEKQPLTTTQQNDLWQTRLKAHQQLYDVIASLNDSQQLYALDVDHTQVTTSVWDFLQTLSLDKLHFLFEHASTAYQQGWLQLAIDTNQNADQSQTIPTLLKQWQQRYPDHPANALLSRESTQSVLESTPKHIALLLPLSGQYKQAGQAIKNGFFAAYYYAKEHHLPTASIDLYDTNKNSIASLYQQAIQQGADFIVGPLLKENVKSLIDSNQNNVPILVLNDVTTNNNDNVFNFSLSPVDEAKQTAEKAFNTNHSQVAIIAPNNQWGQQIAKAFRKKWEQLGGIVIDQMDYTDLNSLSPKVRGLLNIDESHDRLVKLEGMLGHRVRYHYRRRQDIDMVFIVGTAAQAKQIVPLLKFYYANNLPVYSISTVYQGSKEPRYYQDMDGVLFYAMPWVVDPKRTLTPALQSIRDQVASLWPNAFADTPKLFGFGADAYNISMNIRQLQLFPKIGLRGATGRLYLNNQTIERQLLWTQIRYGKIQWIR